VKPATIRLPLPGQRGGRKYIVLGGEPVHGAVPGDVMGFQVVMKPNGSEFWLAEDLAYGSRLTREGYRDLSGLRGLVGERQAAVDALRRAVNEAEQTHQAITEEREARLDRHKARREAGRLERVRPWMGK